VPLIQIPFVHRAEVIPRRCRLAVIRLYRATGFIDVAEIRTSDTEVAYELELEVGNSVQVLQYDGRLLWPAAYTEPLRKAAVIRDALQELLNGQLDLFSDRELALSEPLEQDLSVREIKSDGMDAAVADLHRKAAGCFLVDGKLFIEGGAPIYVASMSQLLPIRWVSSPGVDRSLQPRTDGLALQPAGAHYHGVHRDVAHGSFWLPKKEKESERRRTGYPIIVVRRERELDPVEMRVDAMCRILWNSFRRWAFPPNDENAKTMVAMLDAARRIDQPNLTAVRCEALHNVLATFPERLKPRAQRSIREVLIFAAKANRTLMPEEFQARQSAIEDEAIAALVR